MAITIIGGVVVALIWFYVLPYLPTPPGTAPNSTLPPTQILTRPPVRPGSTSDAQEATRTAQETAVSANIATLTAVADEARAQQTAAVAANIATLTAIAAEGSTQKTAVAANIATLTAVADEARAQQTAAAAANIGTLTTVAERYGAQQTAAARTPHPNAHPVASFDQYPNDSSLRAAWVVNPAWGKNQATLQLDNRSGTPLARLSYHIQDQNEDYVIMDHCLKPLGNWSGARSLEVYVENDNAAKVLDIQFGESTPCTREGVAGTEVWRRQVLLDENQRGWIQIPLSDFQLVPWSTANNRAQDLRGIGYVALGIERPATSPGDIWFGPIRWAP